MEGVDLLVMEFMVFVDLLLVGVGRGDVCVVVVDCGVGDMVVFCDEDLSEVGLLIMIMCLMLVDLELLMVFELIVGGWFDIVGVYDLLGDCWIFVLILWCWVWGCCWFCCVVVVWILLGYEEEDSEGGDGGLGGLFGDGVGIFVERWFVLGGGWVGSDGLVWLMVM